MPDPSSSTSPDSARPGVLRRAAVIRPARDEDAPGIVALIAACWAEYPGCVMDLDGENPELRRFASYCAEQDGAAWTAEQGGELVGMVATAPLGDGEWEIKRLYAARPLRGAGLAQKLLTTAESFAAERGAGRLVLWSDTRFDRAHRFYEKQGYVRAGPIRTLNDLSRSMEFHYAKPISLGIDIGGTGRPMFTPKPPVAGGGLDGGKTAHGGGREQ